ncbi:MAG: hypothetical protein JW829_21135 [Pirellulales bacterium]|nr:hypothetical protein [Pirellulales bacterium]
MRCQRHERFQARGPDGWIDDDEELITTQNPKLAKEEYLRETKVVDCHKRDGWRDQCPSFSERT